MREPRRHRALLISLGVGLGLAALVGVLVLSTGQAPRRDAASSSTVTSSQEKVPLAGHPALAVTSSTIELTDPGRVVISEGVTLAPTRSLPTLVVRPTGTARYPLVIFAAGYDRSPSDYVGLLSVLASRGYVVAAPSFPLEDPARENGLDRADLPNEATDVSFLITALSSGELASSLEPGAVAVVGHSDGADVALMAGYRQPGLDPRIRSVVAIAPDPIDFPHTSGGVPLLLIHGSADQIVDPTSSAQVMSTLSAARWSLTIDGADHAVGLLGTDSWTPATETATAAFLDATVGTTPTSTLGTTLAQIAGTSLEAAAGP